VPVIQRSSLPVPATPLIGRETELAELGALLKNPVCRLITIVGPGGIGKTRLALAAASEQGEAFTHGAAFVPLAAISSATFLAPTILAELDVGLQGQRDLREQLLAYLREKELLLVLDNFEQLLAPDLSENEGGTALLTDVLQRAPGVTLLVTSRERLAVHGEWLFDLSGLNYPTGEAAEAIETFSAVQLFLQRASQVRRQVALAEDETRTVARICRLAEGLPLAIELAAAALRSRSCTVIAAAVETSLSALATGLRAVPERHRSIWATFEHSWRLLSDEERQVFPRLSVFRGGFQEDAAAQVAQASPQLLATLVDKSLLRWDGVARYDMHELLRQNASEKLEQAGEAGGTRKQHAAYFLALAEMAEPQLLSGGRGRWLERLGREYDNLRATLVWSQATADAGEIGLRVVGALLWFWIYRSNLSEGRVWTKGVLATAGGSAQPRAWAQALYSAGALAWMQDDYAGARVPLMESVERWRKIGDQRGLAFALCYLGMVECDQNEYVAAHDLCAESVTIFRELHDSWSLAFALLFFGNVAYERGDYAKARPIYEESEALWRTVDDPWGLARPLTRLGKIACKEGDYATARVLLEQSLALWRQVGERLHLAYVLDGLAEVALMQRDYRQAIAHLVEILALCHEFGLSHGIAQAFEQFARVAAGQAQLERAARLWGAAQAQRQVIRAGIPLGERLGYEGAVIIARAQLGEDAFAAACATGRAMPLEQAIAYAMQGIDGDSVTSVRTASSAQ
jgi:predicted ATPase